VFLGHGILESKGLLQEVLQVLQMAAEEDAASI
jgi:hypothetical protein